MFFIATLCCIYASTVDDVLAEEYGFEHVVHSPLPAPFTHFDGQRPILCILIPDSDNDKICMFDTYTGEYLGDFIVNDTSSAPQYNFQTPVNAIQGPGPGYNIFVSDQISNAIYVFDPNSGQYLYTYADSADGLNNIRGIAFRDDHLFVSSGDYFVMEFDGPHSFLRYFIQDGSNPFDILFLDDDRALVSDIQGTTDNVRLYDTSGILIQELFSASTPEQIQGDTTHQDTFLNCSFAENLIRRFLLDGSIIGSTPFSTPRGIYHLGNGNYFVTNESGVFEVDPANGTIIDQKYTYSARFIEQTVLCFGVRENPCSFSGSALTIFPNPFSKRVSVSLSSDHGIMIKAIIYSIQGKKVADIQKSGFSKGNHALVWDGTDNAGDQVNSGVYFVSIRTSTNQVMTKKILYVK
jgi:hypothetical protein